MVVAIDAFYGELGGRLRRLRVAKRWSQDQLGKSLETPLTRASIANVEAGAQRVYAHTLVELAQALGVSLGDLTPERRKGSLAEDRPHNLAKELAAKLGKRQEQVAELASTILKSKGRRT